MTSAPAHPSRFGSLRHLAGRFFGALSPAGPGHADERWALEQLLPGERELWRAMSGPDRRHALGVARTCVAHLHRDGAQAPRPVVAAALLHDVGKVRCELGTFGRVAVTVAGVVVGHERVAALGAQEGGWRAAAGAYVAHDRIGAELLRTAGSDPLTVAWAEQHHLPPERWEIDPTIGRALKAADDG